MRTIIAGGRDYKPAPYDRKILDDAGITAVVSGGANGADLFGEEWAKDKGIPVIRFSAQWGKHGRAAGPIRNRQMAEYADAVILFKGNKGTKNIKEESVKAGLKIIYEQENSKAL